MRTRTAHSHVTLFPRRMIRVIYGLRERVAKHRRRLVEADPVFSPVIACLGRRPFEKESAHSREWIIEGRVLHPSSGMLLGPCVVRSEVGSLVHALGAGLVSIATATDRPLTVALNCACAGPRSRT